MVDVFQLALDTLDEDKGGIFISKHKLADEGYDSDNHVELRLAGE